MSRMFSILKLLIISILGAMMGWLSGLTYWLNTIPISYLPTHVSVKNDTVFFTLLPLSLLFFWEYKKSNNLLFASQIGILSGPVLGYQFFSSCTTTLETRLNLLFLEPWNYDIPFSIAFGAAIGAFLFTSLVMVFSGSSSLDSDQWQTVNDEGQKIGYGNLNIEAK